MITPEDFAIQQAAIFIDFVLFLIPVNYVLNVHRRTFKLEAGISGDSRENRTSSYPQSYSPSITSEDFAEARVFQKARTPHKSEAFDLDGDRMNTEPAETDLGNEILFE